jgi:glycerol-3-phosphate acyltransferase PlsY
LLQREVIDATRTAEVESCSRRERRAIGHSSHARRTTTGELVRGRLALAAAVGYLAGSFPTADFVARHVARRNNHERAVDLRAAGTKNPGALNAAKVLGTRWGLVVLGGDMLKGAVASHIGRFLARGDGAYVAGIGSVYGHCFPVWSAFRGGKGVATSAGTSIVCFPAYMPFDLALAGATAWLSKGQAGVATYISSGVFTAAALYWHRAGRGNLWGPAATRWLPIYAASTSTVIALKFLTAPPLSAAEPVIVQETDVDGDDGVEEARAS